jgi:hypothetical protein
LNERGQGNDSDYHEDHQENNDDIDFHGSAVAGLVGNEGGVVSGVVDL